MCWGTKRLFSDCANTSAVNIPARISILMNAPPPPPPPQPLRRATASLLALRQAARAIVLASHTTETFSGAAVAPRKVKRLPLIKAELMSGAHTSAQVNEFVFIETQKARFFLPL